MKEDILKLLPEINKIKDKKLKEKVMLVWEQGIKEGGWKIEDLEKIPFTLLIKDLKINLIQHTRAVINTSFEAAKILIEIYGNLIRLDMDVLLAGAILHDVGKLIEYKEVKGNFVKSDKGKLLRHPFSGANLAAKCGLPEEVIHVIAVHSKEGDLGKRTAEGTIVYHADYINFESLGGKL
ncbi:MAG: HDIG domain-containing metalloprotein [Candidatus Zixiibacteriota bacterium]